MVYRKKFNIGDRVRIMSPHHGAGAEFTLTKVGNYITHYLEGVTDDGGHYNVPTHWCELVKVA